MTNTLLTRSELAQRWQVTERWIELHESARLDSDPLPRIKLGHRTIRYVLAECEAWARRRNV